MSAIHVMVKRGGQIVLPEHWREANQVKEGDLIQLADIGDGVIILMHRKSGSELKSCRKRRTHKSSKPTQK